MGFWTFLLGVPPVKAETEEIDGPHEDKEAGGDEADSDAPSLSTDDAEALVAEAEESSAEEGESQEAALDLADTHVDEQDETSEAEMPLVESATEVLADDLSENIFVDEIDPSGKVDQAGGTDEPLALDTADAAVKEEDEDSRLLDTLMAVGAAVDREKDASPETEPASEEISEPEPEPELEVVPLSQPSGVAAQLLDLSSGHKNDEVRATLAAMGDDGSAPRQVIHFAYASEGAAPQDEVATVLGEQDFEVIDAGEQGAIRMEHTREVASADFDAFTDLLEAELDAKGWEYDGWECAVAGA